MTGLMKRISEEMATIPIGDLATFDEPDAAVEPNCKVVGVLSDDLKRLFILRRCALQKGREMEAKKIEVLVVGPMREGSLFNSKNLLQKAMALMMEESRPIEEWTTLLDTLFWQSVRFAFPETKGKSISINVGWQVSAENKSTDDQ